MLHRILLHRLRRIAFVFALATIAAPAAWAADIHVMISGGFSPAYAALGPAFEQASGHRLVTVRGASSGDSPNSIPSRLKRGEPVDVFIMVGAFLDDLERQGFVRAGSKVNLAQSTMGMVVRAGAAKPDIGTVDALRRVLLEAKSIGHSESASGIYLTTVLYPRLGVQDVAAPKSRKIVGDLVGNAVGRGEVEIGFQQVSELLAASGVTFVGELPAELQQDTTFAAGLSTVAQQPEAAAALVRFLAAPAAAQAIAKTGLRPVAR